MAHAAVWLIGLIPVLVLAAAPVAHAAVANDDAYISNGVDVLVMDVLANDKHRSAYPIFSVSSTDIPYDFTEVYQERFGTMTTNGTHVIYTPGSDPWNLRTPEYQYRIQDGLFDEGDFGIIHIVISPTGAIDAVDDRAVTVIDKPVLIDVLANDINATGAGVEITGQPAAGTADIHGNIIRYMPGSGHTGSDTITYTATGAYQSSTDTATVNITVADSVLMAVDDDLPLRNDLFENVLDVRANDIGADGATVEIISEPSIGTAEVVDNLIHYSRHFDSIDFTPGYLRYRVTFGNYSDTAELKMEYSRRFLHVDDDHVLMPRNRPADVDVTANDLNVVRIKVDRAVTGSASEQPGNIARYVPERDFAGTDSFMYWAQYHAYASEIADVHIMVLDLDVMAKDDTVLARAGKPVTIDVLANDISPGGTWVEIATAPSRGSADVVGSRIVYTPTVFDNVTDTITYRISDGDGSDWGRVFITIEHKPVLAEIPGPVTVPEHEEHTFVAGLLPGADVPGRTFGLAGAPDGAGIDPASGNFSWTPAEEHGGQDHTFMVTVMDRTGAAVDGQEVTITVTEVNDMRPFMEPVEDAAISAGQTVSFYVNATDIDTRGGLRHVVDPPLPAGVTDSRDILDRSSGYFSWTPNENQTGVHTVNLRVWDGFDGDARQSFDIAVHGPVLAAIPTGTTIPEHAEYAFDADLVDGADVPGHAFGLAGAPGGSAIDPATGIFSWTPSEDQGGNRYTFAVTVADGSRVTVDRQSVTIAVSEANPPPVVEPVGNITVFAGQTVSFYVNATDIDTRGGLRYIVDPPRPPGVSGSGEILDRNTGHFNWTTGENHAGTHVINLRVWDGQSGDRGQTRQSFAITVSGDNPPPVIEPIGDTVAVPGRAVSFYVNATDIGTIGGLRYLLLPPLPAGVNDGSDILDGSTGHFDWTPTPDNLGPNEIRLRVWDGQPHEQGQAHRNFTIRVIDAGLTDPGSVPAPDGPPAGIIPDAPEDGDSGVSVMPDAPEDGDPGAGIDRNGTGVQPDPGIPVHQPVPENRTTVGEDTTAPVITITGDNPLRHELGAPYVDPGATADDGSPVVADYSAVNAGRAGNYTVTYTATDDRNNTAVANRTVIVADTTPPAITLAGNSTVTIERGGTYDEPGARVADNDPDYDGAVVIDASRVETGTAGNYTVFYTAPADAAGNEPSPANRTVLVVDTVAPVIVLNPPDPQIIELGDPYADPGATADDGSPVTADTSAVDAGRAGNYTVTYTAADASNNTAAANRTVIIRDTVAPVIALNPPDPQITEKDSAYADPGANVTDNDPGYDGTVLIDASRVETGTAGNYTVFYTAPADAAGNEPSPANRTVLVVDTTAPIITVLGDNPLQHELGAPYVDPGAVTSDGSEIRVASTVNASRSGNYTVTYTAADDDGNAAVPETRTVHVRDTTPPVITLNPPDPQIIERGTAYAELGANVTDNDPDYDGTVTVDASRVDAGTAGNYTVTYTAADASNNTAVAVRTVIVVDTVAPVITLNPPDPQIIELGDPYADPGATAGDGSPVTADASAVNTAKAGNYTVTYTAADASNNTAVAVRTVIVRDTVAPTIRIDGSDRLLHELGEPYADPGANVTDNDPAYDGTVTVDASRVEAGRAGNYTVTYAAPPDGAGNEPVLANRTVIVADTTPPVITLNPPDPQIIEKDSTYADPGANVTDNDPRYNGTVVIDASRVETGTAGNYTVTYTAPADAAGNEPSPVNRTVIVADTTPPVITITGDSLQIIELGETYVDPGAAAGDGSTIRTASTVNASKSGNYTVTYTATDGYNNTVVAVRTVQVRDTTPPVITPNPPDPQIIERGTAYVELGANVTDNDPDYDGTVTVDASRVETGTAGNYTVFYTAPADAAGNEPSPANRTVLVVDTTAPIITVFGDNPLQHELGEPYVDPGAVTSDGSEIRVASTVNASKVGNYTVTYTAADDDGNTAVPETRTVQVRDTTPPVITPNPPDPQIIELGDPYAELGANVTDNDPAYDGTVVIDASRVKTGTAGNYTVTYTATDAGNNTAAANRTVIVADTTPPVITISGNTTLRHELGSPYVDPGATAADGSPVTADTSAVNIGQSGNYTVTYTATDAGNNTAVAVRTVIVRDTTPPVIGLTGASTITIGLGGTYADPGANVTDNDPDYAGTATGAPSVIDTAVQASHAVTYTAPPDSAGNEPVPVTRTVLVRDLRAPNVPPVAPDEKVSTEEESTATIMPEIYDRDGTPAITSVGGASKGQTGLVNATAIYYAPYRDETGTDSFAYTVTDDRGGNATGIINVTITPVNDPPVLAPIGDMEIGELEPLDIQLGAADVDNATESLVWTHTGAPAGLDITGNRLTWTPSEGQGGRSYTFVITVSDDIDADSQTVTFTVAGTGRTPAPGYITGPDGRNILVAPISDAATGRMLEAYMSRGLVVFAGFLPDPGDIAGAIPAGPDGFLYAGILVSVPDAGRPEAGLADYVAGRGDAAGLSVFVGEMGNVPPVLSEIGGYAINAQDTLTFEVYATDFDDDDDNAASYRLSGAPTGAEISGEGVFRWTPGSADVGDRTFVITAYDRHGATDTESVTITVLPAGTPNESPTAPDVAATVSPDGRILIIPAISDPDGDPTRITGATGNAVGTIISSDNGIEYIAGPNPGAETITYTVADGRSGLATGTITITIQ